MSLALSVSEVPWADEPSRFGMGNLQERTMTALKIYGMSLILKMKIAKGLPGPLGLLT
jgi:hypothetical protein